MPKNTFYPDEYSAAIKALWCVLRGTFHEPGYRYDTRKVEMIVKDGHLAGYHVGDYLYAIVACDSPWNLEGHWPELASLSKIPITNMYYRPRTNDRNAWGCGNGLSAIHLAALLVQLSHWGVRIDPTPLVAAVLPEIKAKKIISEPELRVLWFSKERGRMDIQYLPAEMPEELWGEVALPEGYRARCTSAGVMVASPKVSKAKWRDAFIRIDNKILSEAKC